MHYGLIFSIYPATNFLTLDKFKALDHIFQARQHYNKKVTLNSMISFPHETLTNIISVTIQLFTENTDLFVSERNRATL